MNPFMKTQRILLAIALAASLQYARDVLADGDEDYAPHDKVQPAETDVDEDGDDSREVDVDDAGDKSREVGVDAAGDASRAHGVSRRLRRTRRGVG
jgi:hypothetical protein